MKRLINQIFAWKKEENVDFVMEPLPFGTLTKTQRGVNHLFMEDVKLAHPRTNL